MQKAFLKVSSNIRVISNKITRPVSSGLGIVVVLSIFVLLWQQQQKNIDLLAGKIRTYETSITKASSDERLKLEKDILGFEKDKTIIQNGAYMTIVQALGGIVLIITAYIGWLNFKVAEDKQVTERFSKSIELLGGGKINIRLGGIYALEQIAIDSLKYHWTIVEILSAFIRENSPINNMETIFSSSEKDEKLSIDIQAAIIVLGRRKFIQDPLGKKIDLRRVNLLSTEMQSANLSHANLSDSNLSSVNLSHANLSGANLSRSNLSSANLSHANLSGANLSGTNLSDSNLSSANLGHADLSSTNLSSSNLSSANFLDSVKLTQKQLDSAIFNENTKLPNHLKF
jgi:uncharacterized protein YjbI with pentapeptide repeats